MNRSRILLFVSFILIAGLSACSKDEKSPQATLQKRVNLHNFSKLSAKILPEEPTVAEDLQVVFTGSGNVRYRWDKNGQLIEGANGPILTRKLFSRGDRITVRIVTNGQEDSASLTIGNAPPQVTSVAVSPENICRGVDLTAIPQGFDADGDSIRYGFKWLINGQELPEDTPVLKGGRFNSGERISLKVTPSDDQDAGKEYATQAFTVPNCAPYFVTTPPTAFEGNTYSYEARAEDPDGDAIRYSLVSAPPGMTINSSSGRLVWKVARQPGNYDIEIEAKDDKGLATYQKYTLSINIL
jgi:hypothetical protein